LRIPKELVFLPGLRRQINGDDCFVFTGGRNSDVVRCDGRILPKVQLYLLPFAAAPIFNGDWIGSVIPDNAYLISTAILLRWLL
jgi:hypothetical protein